jgi:hypothetical protein
MSHQAWPLPKSFEKLLIYPIFIHQDTGMWSPFLTLKWEY